MNKNLKTVYIFCEGYTEEYYFNFIRKLYRDTPVKINSIHNLKRGGEFQNIRKLNKRIESDVKKEEKRLKGAYEKGSKREIRIYAVFDLDIFSKQEIDELYNGINKNTILIPTNMTFEYWILSHFQEYNLENGKKEYLLKIINHIKSVGFTLEKDKFTGENDFEWLNKNLIKYAKENVKKTNKEYGNMKDKDPYSDVYKIIEFLEN